MKHLIKKYPAVSVFCIQLVIQFMLLPLSLQAQSPNNNYMKRKIIHVLEIRAVPETINKALTTIEGLKGWWTENTSGSPQKGGTIWFRFADVFKPDMLVQENIEMLIKWKCNGGEKDWADDIFSFEMEKKENTVQLTFIQDYQNEISDDTYGRFNYNWGYYLHSLKQYCETGKGTPFGMK